MATHLPLELNVDKKFRLVVLLDMLHRQICREETARGIDMALSSPNSPASIVI